MFELAKIMDRCQRIVTARSSVVRYSTYCRDPTARNINHTAKLRKQLGSRSRRRLRSTLGWINGRSKLHVAPSLAPHQ